MSDGLAIFSVIVVIAYLSFIGGCLVGQKDMAELEDAGYRIVRHEIRHGEFHTNWIEVVRKEDVK